MDKHIAQALNSLIPTLTGPLPPELLELAASLLAQSRSKASSLKAEEEIARSYACANIACERLRQNLALPKIEPRPPCPPKVYQKLYRYLDGVLPAGMRRINSSFKGYLAPTSNSSTHVRPDKPAQSINSRRKVARRDPAEIGAPVWVMPVIRHLCKTLCAPVATPHVFAGVSSILSSDDRPADINVPALITTTCILTLNTITGDETAPAEYLQRREAALTAVQEALAQQGVQVKCSQVDIDDCMRQVNKYGWTDMDWFENLEKGSCLNETEHGEEGYWANDADNQEGRILPIHSHSPVSMDLDEGGYLQAGLGTMMDERVDYLSDEKRRSYERWKKETLLQIDKLEARSQETALDGG